MKAKTIEKVLAKKFGEWLDSIEDNDVKSLVAKNTIITGGAIASMLLGEDVNDFDVYFTNWATTHAVAQYYVKRFTQKKANGIPCAIFVGNEVGDPCSPGGRVKVYIKSAGIASAESTEKPYEYFESSQEGRATDYVSEVMTDPGEIEDTYTEVETGVLRQSDDEQPKYRPVFMSSNAITLSGKVQVILRFFGNAEELHENYDFVHCMNYWTSAEKKVVLRQPALEALLAKELRYVGSKYPLCSIMRLRKFIKRGWTVNAGQILKMAMQLNAMDLLDPAVLEDQLTGVDSAYFAEVIRKLAEKDPEKINCAYLIEIIDRMF